MQFRDSPSNTAQAKRINSLRDLAKYTDTFRQFCLAF